VPGTAPRLQRIGRRIRTPRSPYQRAFGARQSSFKGGGPDLLVMLLSQANVSDQAARCQAPRQRCNETRAEVACFDSAGGYCERRRTNTS
jgi:hypothetical protein